MTPIPTHRRPTHPGEMLLKEFIEPLDLNQTEFARRVGIPFQHLSEIIHGQRAITTDIAFRLETLLGMDATFWLNLQRDWNLAVLSPTPDHGLCMVCGRVGECGCEAKIDAVVAARLETLTPARAVAELQSVMTETTTSERRILENAAWVAELYRRLASLGWDLDEAPPSYVRVSLLRDLLREVGPAD